MAKSSSKENTSNKLLWIAGGAAVTAFAVYAVNKYLKDREELMMMRMLEKQRESGGELKPASKD